MAEHSNIEWTDATWNPITGCTLVSEGCRNCYAATLAATRLKNHPSRKGLARLNARGEAKFTGEVRLNEQWLDQPLRWKRPRMIFVCAHGDLFHENVPDEWIDRVFAVMALAPQHTFQVLTKRPERMLEYLTEPRLIAGPNEGMATSKFHIAHTPPVLDPLFWDVTDWPLPNVWLGTSVEDQATADARIPHLLATPAAVGFVSAEPLLGEVDLSRIPKSKIAPNITILTNALTGIDGLGNVGPRLGWIICGGESGKNARPMHPDWARSLRDQCVADGVPFHFKQWGEWMPSDRETSIIASNGELIDFQGEKYAGRGGHQSATHMIRVGKKRAGRLLDGRTWDELPGARP